MPLWIVEGYKPVAGEKTEQHNILITNDISELNSSLYACGLLATKHAM